MKKKYGNTLFFKFSCNRILSCPGKLCKDSVKPIQGCADDLFESFPFVLRIVYCNVRHHGNNPGSAAIAREIARDAVTAYEVGKGLIANRWYKPVFTMAVKPKSG